jgi:DNA-binding LytR/AlgR family response regulator
MKKIKCLIVDDEPLALDVLEGFIESNPDLECCGRAENAIRASELLKQNHVDLIFLDIHMPEIDGISFAKSLENPPLIVFTTAYSEYALTGFELNAIDYLLKPISPDRFQQAVDKVKEYLNLRQKNDISNPEINEEYIFIKADQKQHKVGISEILYIEAFADYVKIFIPEKRLVTLQTMKNMEKKLPEEHFCRIHRSYIVGLKHINSFSSSEVGVADKKLPVGKNYRERFMSIMSGFHSL